ncbi:MAG: hypothetical protein GF353_15680 [Candidatus Lokiarchaeota archaeon]|nr:hypothetical protein [Candidatus Lokiarchaeota archaeon]
MSDAIFGIAGTILGTCLGFLLNRIAAADNERKFKKQQFECIRTRIATTTMYNKLNARLLEMKNFIEFNSSYLNNDNWRQFLSKWLMDPLIDEPINATAKWNSSNRQEMLTELMNLKL